MIIPLDQLNQETLHAIIEAFVLREGTEYGFNDIPLAQKIAQVHQQLTSGKAVLVYSQLHESVDIVPAEKFNSDTEE